MKKTITIITDDLTGEEGARTRTFSIGNTIYEIDLTDENYRGLDEALVPFVAKARRLRKSVAGKVMDDRTKAERAETQRIRAWAKEQGLPVGVRGRIPAEIRQAYASR